MRRLRTCEAWEAFTTTVISDNEGKTLVVELTPVALAILALQPHPHNRTFVGIIEATVHAMQYLISRGSKE